MKIHFRKFFSRALFFIALAATVSCASHQERTAFKALTKEISSQNTSCNIARFEELVARAVSNWRTDRLLLKRFIETRAAYKRLEQSLAKHDLTLQMRVSDMAKNAGCQLSADALRYNSGASAVVLLLDQALSSEKSALPCEKTSARTLVVQISTKPNALEPIQRDPKTPSTLIFDVNAGQYSFLAGNGTHPVTPDSVGSWLCLPLDQSAPTKAE